MEDPRPLLGLVTTLPRCCHTSTSLDKAGSEVVQLASRFYFPRSGLGWLGWLGLLLVSEELLIFFSS
jgi:hypothetical protein